jgi:hypothetical protein
VAASHIKDMSVDPIKVDAVPKLLLRWYPVLETGALLFKLKVECIPHDGGSCIVAGGRISSAVYASTIWETSDTIARRSSNTWIGTVRFASYVNTNKFSDKVKNATFAPSLHVGTARRQHGGTGGKIWWAFPVCASSTEKMPQSGGALCSFSDWWLAISCAWRKTDSSASAIHRDD